MTSSRGEYRNRLDEPIAPAEIDRQHAGEQVEPVEPAFAEPTRGEPARAGASDAGMTRAGRGEGTLTEPPVDWDGDPAADLEPGTAVREPGQGMREPDPVMRDTDRGVRGTGPAVGESPGAADPVGGASTNGGRSTNDTDLGEHDPLIPTERGADYQTRWRDVQVSFVDEPRSAVSQADALVGDLLDQLADTFRNQRQALEQAWNADQVSTEDLRVAMNRYRTFFDRLLSL